MTRPWNFLRADAFLARLDTLRKRSNLQLEELDLERVDAILVQLFASCSTVRPCVRPSLIDLWLAFTSATRSIWSPRYVLNTDIDHPRLAITVMRRIGQDIPNTLIEIASQHPQDRVALHEDVAAAPHYVAGTACALARTRWAATFLVCTSGFCNTKLACFWRLGGSSLPWIPMTLPISIDRQLRHAGASA
jgi:hypothetical protein